MTVYIEKPSLNLREELASLRNQGGYEEQQFYFDGLVTNGTFDTNVAGWSGSMSGTISYSSGKAVIQSNGASWSGASQPVSFRAGKTYLVSLDVISRTGNLYLYTDDLAGSASKIQSIGTATTTGTFSTTFTCSTDASFITLTNLNVATSDVWEIDNVSLYETDGTDVVHRMPKGWVPLHVYEDGLLQREGAANDYEVVYDGFDYYVKPAVAPSATTQTCVIGVRK